MQSSDQESIQSSTTPGPGYQLENDKLTVRHHKREPRVSLFQAADHKAHINRRTQRHRKRKTEKNIKDPQMKYSIGAVSKIFYCRAYVADVNTCNELLTQKLLKQCYWYHKLRKTFSKFKRRCYDLISKFQAGLKSLWRQCLWEPEFYGDLL